jgi:hypothetical protein
MNIYVIYAILIYFMLVYLFIGIPWLVYLFGKHDWIDKWVVTAVCAVFPFMAPVMLGVYIIWLLLKILFGLLVFAFMILAYVAHWLEDHLPNGTLFQTWFAVADEFFELLIKIFNFLLGLQLNPLKKAPRPTDESASA